ncbi:S8 family serine peptidase [Solirubrobacter soli]|uniref:S8 family serine peptidase n=1 Tax=Solirubrobacter soli TaxID=363832 RepID=UPI0004066B80|nr:S8 family serine peptidase [Solirubrobacter soli]
MTHSRVGLACAVALLCVIGCSVPAAANAAEVIVRRDPGLSANQRAEIRADAGVRHDRTLDLADTEVVTVPDAEQAHAVATLNADPDVRYAVPNVQLRVASDDDKQSMQWWLDNDPSKLAKIVLDLNPIPDSDIDAVEAWDIMEGQGVTVGVADQSVYAAHPDLAGNVEPGEDFVTEGCSAGDPVGFADHGTQVAGIVAALRDNGGIAGVAPLAHVKPLRVADNCGVAKLSAVIDAFTAAGRQQIPVVTASFGTEPGVPDPALNQTFVDLFDSYPNTLFVVAAGNEGADVDQEPVYPCSTKRPGADPDIANLLCVGMTDVKDDPACWGNVGQTSVDLFAPGVAIYSTVRGSNPWLNGTGTSMAVPMVAGAAAIVLSTDSRLGPAQIAQKLRDTVDYKTPLEGISVAGGRLNVARAADAPGRLGSGGGESKTWVSCDRDHDHVRDDRGQDLCPDQPGTIAMRGCPDTDGDGIADSSDNCATVANADQADTDGDRVGNACDANPRGDDADGDGIPSMDDRCPTEFGAPPDGCPIVVKPPDTPEPTPTPTATPTVVPDAVIVSLSAKISKCPKGKQCKKTAKVTVKLSRQGKVALKVERQERKKGRLVWKRIKSQSLTANARGKTVTVRGKSAKTTSTYRVTATFAGKVKAVSFKV